MSELMSEYYKQLRWAIEQEEKNRWCDAIEQQKNRFHNRMLVPRVWEVDRTPKMPENFLFAHEMLAAPPSTPVPDTTQEIPVGNGPAEVDEYSALERSIRAQAYVDLYRAAYPRLSLSVEQYALTYSLSEKLARIGMLQWAKDTHNLVFY